MPRPDFSIPGGDRWGPCGLGSVDQAGAFGVGISGTTEESSGVAEWSSGTDKGSLTVRDGLGPGGASEDEFVFDSAWLAGLFLDLLNGDCQGAKRVLGGWSPQVIVATGAPQRGTAAFLQGDHQGGWAFGAGHQDLDDLFQVNSLDKLGHG